MINRECLLFDGIVEKIALIESDTALLRAEGYATAHIERFNAALKKQVDAATNFQSETIAADKRRRRS